MEWTFAEFFASGGTTTFVDRLSASLGIHASEIKVVSVYEGSLVIDYELISSNGNQTALQEIQEKQVDMMATGKLDLGAPILDSSVGGSKVVEDGVVVKTGYTPIIITPTVTNLQNNPGLIIIGQQTQQSQS